MIDFRYHLVSVIAIFLALAIGIVVGTTALNGAVLTDVKNQVTRLSSDKVDQRQAIDTLQERVGDQMAFITRAEPALERNQLAGQRVAVIAAPGAPADVGSGLLAALQRAGAVVTTDVRLSPSWADPKDATSLDDLATRLVLPDAGLPANSTGAELAAAELAAVLVGKPGGRPVAADAIQTTLAGFQQGGFLSVSGTPGAQAPLAVLIVPPAPKSSDDTTAALATRLVDLATRLGQRAAGAVVAGPETATASGGVLAAARSDRDVQRVASTVDSVENAAGRVATVLALRGALSGKSGAFGFGPGAAAPLPSPVASPSPSR